MQINQKGFYLCSTLQEHTLSLVFGCVQTIEFISAWQVSRAAPGLFYHQQHLR